MINLIPKAEKKKKIIGFYYKLIVLFFVVGSFAFFVVSAATLPSYFLSSVRKNIANVKIETQTKEQVPLPDQKTLSVIKDLNSKLDLIESTKNNKFTVSEKVINAVILKKIPGITITDISYVNNPSQGSSAIKTGKKISIQGNASSREVLLLFRNALENSATLKQVDLPISNFVKGSNIQFYLSLMPL